jgi:hypothetical protein
LKVCNERLGVIERPIDVSSGAGQTADFGFRSRAEEASAASSAVASVEHARADKVPGSDLLRA